MAAFARVRVEHHDALGPLGVVGEAESVRRARVPDTLAYSSMKVVVAEKDEVRLERGEVDLDLVDVSVLGLELLDPGMGDEQVGAVRAPRRTGLAEGVERGLHAEHLRDGMHHDPAARARDIEPLVSEAAGEVELGEGVRQS